MKTTLSESQIDLLRWLARQSDAVLVDNLDGRVVRALRARECVEVRSGWVRVTGKGRELAETGGRRKRVRRPRMPDAASKHARAEAIHRAVEALELALPRDSEVAVGAIFAYADDVVLGLRRYASRLERARSASAARA